LGRCSLLHLHDAAREGGRGGLVLELVALLPWTAMATQQPNAMVVARSSRHHAKLDQLVVSTGPHRTG
jgi:hypothetical protein